MKALKHMFRYGPYPPYRGIPKKISLLFLCMGMGLGLYAQVTPVGPETQTNTTTANNQQNPAVAMDTAGNYVAVWESLGTDGSDYGIYGQRYSAGGNPDSAEFRVNTTTAQGQRFPSVAMDVNGNAVVVWMDAAADGSGWGIYAQQYDNTGAASGSEILVNTTTTGHQKFPQVAMNDQGDYVVTWMEAPLTGFSFQVKAQRFNFSSGAQGGEIEVDTASSNCEGYPVVAMAQDGSFTIAWQRVGTDGSGMAVVARRYDPTGTALAAPFQVNTTTAENQQAPGIAMDTTGNTLIVWTSYNQDGDSEGIYGQWLLPDGNTNGPEFKISTYSTLAQTEPVVSASREGCFSVAWSSYGQDSSFTGVYFKVLNPIGDTAAVEVQVNTRTQDFQQFPALAQRSNSKELVVLWQDGLRNSTATQDGSNYGIFAQRFSVIKEPLPPVAVCQDLTVTADSNCVAEVTGDQIDNGSSDPDADPLTFTLVPAGPYPLGTNNVELIVADGTGLFDTCMAVITVEENFMPVPDVEFLPEIMAECSTTVSTIPTATDNCAGTILGTTNDPLTYTEQGFYLITWTYDDGNGNSIFQTQEVFIEDMTAPVPDASYQDTIRAECSATVTAPTGLDNCDGLIKAITVDDTVFTTLGTYQIIWEFIDSNGNGFFPTTTVIIEDTNPPVPVQPNIDFTGICEANIAFPPNALDNCAGAIVGTTSDPTFYNQLGTYQITWTYDDGNGNTSQQIQTVTVSDPVSPVLVGLPSDTSLCGNQAYQPAIPTATDNCPFPVGVQCLRSDGMALNDPYPVGITTITCTATDQAGNTSQDSFNVEILPADTTLFTAITCDPNQVGSDTTFFLNQAGCDSIVINETILEPEPLVITCPPDVGLSCELSTDPINTGSASSLGGCGLVGVTFSDVIIPGSCPNNFTISRTWVVADTTGQVDSCVQLINVIDESIPIIPNPLPINYSCASEVVAPGPLSLIDNCGDTIIANPVLISTVFNCVNDYEELYQWTFTDACGNTSITQQTIIVKDTVPPAAPVAPADLTVACASEVPAPIDLTATDNCGASITVSPSIDITLGVCPNDFTEIRTWTFVDTCGNTSIVSQTITVQDTVPPAVPAAPDDLTLSCASEVPAAIDLTATDNCGGSITVSPSIDITPGVCLNDFIEVRTWTFVDTCGNTSIVSQTITVQDTVPPAAPAAPADLTVACASEVPAPIDLTATDNCGASITVSPSIDITPGVCLNDFIEVRTWTFVDTCGNTSIVSQTITVQDTVPPAAPSAPADLTVACASDVPAAIDLTATDNCGGAITVSPVIQTIPGVCLNDFTEIRTWTFVDTCGNTSIVSQTITVQDTVPPAAPAAPADLIVACASEVPAAIDLTATDNCGASITVSPSIDITPGVCLNDFTEVRTWTFVDTCGNTSIVSQTITVQDTVPPAAPSAPADLTVACASDVPAAIDLTATDNCGGAIRQLWGGVSPVIQTIPGVCLNDFTEIRTWTFVDTCGNTSIVSQTITVQDTVPPAAPAAPADLTVACAAEVPAAIDLTATDNCGASITVSPSIDITPGVCPNDFTEIRTWTFVDTCGNTSSVSQTIIVQDTVPPAAPAAPADLTVACASEVPAAIDLTATDNCGASITVSPSIDITPGVCLNDFIEVRTWTFVDTCGNTSSVSQTIIVQDTVPPAAPAAPADLTVACAADVPAAIDLTATDNCGGSITVSPSIDITPGVCLNDFTEVRTWTFVDTCGNTSSVSQTIIVQDTVSPTLVDVPADIVVCEFQPVTFPLPTATDNCAGTPSVSCVRSDGLSFADPYPVGVTTITCTATDSCGNSSSSTFTVTVDPPENIALNKPAETPCDYGNSYAGLGVDGNPGGNTPWTANPDLVHVCQGFVDPWWQVDLGDGIPGQTFKISEICVYNRTSGGPAIRNRLSDFYLLISCEPFDENASLTDLLNDSDIYHQFVPGTAGYPSCIAIPEVVGQYVRIQLPGNVALHFGELEVYGCPEDPGQCPAPDPCLVFPQPEITPAGPFLSTAGLQQLQATPAGGIWGGMVSATGEFDPSMGVGSYEVTYTLQDSICMKSDTILITVIDSPSVCIPINMSEGKPAEQSSTYGLGVASIAVDGDTDGSRGPWANASIQHTQVESQAWWKVDLEEVVDIKYLEIFNRTDCCSGRLRDFYIFSSNDPIDASQSIASLTNDPAISHEFFSGIAAASVTINVNMEGRYVAIKLSSNNTPLHMAEVKVFGCPVGSVDPPLDCDGQTPENLALNGLASQSSTYGNGVASLAIDGNTTGSSPWSADLQHTTKEPTPWWYVELGVNASIEAVKIYNRTGSNQGRLKNFYVFVSENPIDGTRTIADLTSDAAIENQFFSGSAGADVTLNFGGVPGSYVLVKLTGDPGILHMAEVEVLGCDLSTSGNRFADASSEIQWEDPIQMEAYPNPFFGTFTLEIKGELKETGKLQLVNALGQILEVHEVSGNQRLTLGKNIAKGIYFVQLVEGDNIHQIKVVKAK